MHFLMRCQATGIARLGTRLSSEAPLSRALLAPAFPEREFTRDGKIRDLLKGSLEEQLAAARELQRRNVTLASLGLRQRDLSSSCRNALRALGVIRRRHRTESDWIAEGLESLYGCSGAPIWHILLGTEYEHASQILVEAGARFPGASSEWLSLQDSFNDIAVRQFFAFLKNHGLPGHSRTIGGSGKLVKYGSLIQKDSPFDRQYGGETPLFRKIHSRRNKLPGSHPYDERGGAKNSWLKRPERDDLAVAVRNALDGLIAVVQANTA